MSVTLHIHGAARTVTGSCLLFDTGRAQVLVDAGLFQGPKTLKALNYRDFPFDPAKLDAVLLTHAHIDHSGQIPRLIGAGFRGRVHATAGTRDLCSVLLPDAGHIQEFEVETLNRRNARRGRPAVTPIYTAADARASLRAFRAEPYGSWFEPAHGVRARFWNAGHILGSASLELMFEDGGGQGRTLSVLVSGDLGPGEKAFQAPPDAPRGVDYVLCESTYGGTDRPVRAPKDRREHLAEEIRNAADPGGVLLLPAFAVERMQELLLDLVGLMQRGEIPEAPVFLDSPLGARATEVFQHHASELEDGAELVQALGAPFLHITESSAASRQIGDTAGFHIILAGSGMCDAGRIRHHLRQWLWRRTATVLLTGFQATGTLGRILKDGATSVRIQGDEVSVRARIRFMDDYSGHADGAELASWLLARQPIRAGVLLTHGEPESVEALGARIAGRLGGCRIVLPALDEAYVLGADGPTLIDAPQRLPPELVGRPDWHNERSRLILDLSARLDAAPDDAARTALLRRLRATLEALAEA